MNESEYLNYVNTHPAKKVKLAVSDIDGILRGKYISVDKFFSVRESHFGFCNVIFGWDCGDVSYDNAEYTGWHTGYPDAPAVVDAKTFRKIPWEEDVPFFLCDLTGDSQTVCPRNLLKKIIAEAKKDGFRPMFSQEFEWFNFEETPSSLRDKNFNNLTPLTPGMFGYSILRSSLRNDFFKALFDYLPKFGIPIEGLHTETGPGVFEAAIAYSDILEAADRALLFKTAVKEIAYKLGIMATFMAKWNPALPGCGGHVHQSLLDSSEKNIFYSEKEPNSMSEIFRSYIAGQLYCMPHILPLFAPNINSFKRLVEGAWAPTTLTWGIDNRTVCLRALPLGNRSSRLETRVIGADANPYLAMAGCLASGLYGIRNRLKLQEPTKGNGYRDYSHGVIPPTLWDAVQIMKNSEVAKGLFGEKFVAHFTQSREWECREYNKSVTDWELKRYFEII